MQILVRSAGSPEWSARPLGAGECVELDGLVRLVGLAENRCLLLARGRVFVNGEPALGARLLAHRDEIQAASTRAIFDAETSQEEGVYATTGGPEEKCPTCHGAMQAGDAMSRCPLCRSAYHRDCWSAGAQCHNCGRTSGATSRPPEEI